MADKNDMILDVTPSVKWIGILDFDIRTFDIVMTTEFGTTYNSYFIDAEKKTIIETSKAKFNDAYLAKVKSVVDPAEIQYIVLDHTEPDHSGSLEALLEIAVNATVVGSGNAIRYLKDIVVKPFKSWVVKEGDTLDLGNKTLRFISAPNLHWPDSIFTYLVEDKLLFTCDSFGAHFCRKEMFDDLTGDYTAAFKYYFDVILKPYSKFMLNAIEKIRPLEIDMICPGHGPILRKNWKSIVDLTEQYATEYVGVTGGQGAMNVLIAYVSAYGYTKQMAEFIAEGIKKVDDVNVELVDIENILLGELDSKVTLANGLLVGSPTINQNTLLPIYKMFAVINPLRDKGKLAGAFGSYGWSGEAPRIIIENLKILKLYIFEETGAFKFYPGNEKEEALIEYGKKFAEKLSAECQ